jgi:type II secretory pathway pseudopilin PulG
MIFRRPVTRMGRPSLIGTAARTAVVAGTASAVAGSVARGQQARAEQAAQAQAFQQQQQAATQQAAIDQAVAQQLAAQQAATPAPVAPAPDSGGPAGPAGAPQPDIIGQLTQLAALRDQGILTDAEFETQKARILAQ